MSDHVLIQDALRNFNRNPLTLEETEKHLHVAFPDPDYRSEQYITGSHETFRLATQLISNALMQSDPPARIKWDGIQWLCYGCFMSDSARTHISHPSNCRLKLWEAARDLVLTYRQEGIIT